MFLDEITLEVSAGDGGSGAIAFRREKYVPHGGPAGGDGGKGGDVVFVAVSRLNTFRHLEHKRRFQAESGKPGGTSNKTGASADDLIIEVPRGTLIRDADTSDLLADLTLEGQRAVVARGGRGGQGNARFKSSTNQAPRVAERGEPGEQRTLHLELKLLADVGIIGVPNAGKSTLLSVISAAKPKIAAYPFTTLEPNLGVAAVEERDIVFADIPGLVEGAHAGIGLGHSFLRHIQRTRLLLHLLDGASQNPLLDFQQINTELALFDERLLQRPQIVVLNKADLPDTADHWQAVQQAAAEHDYPVFLISAVAQQGIRELLYFIAEQIEALPEPEPPEEIPVFSPEAEELFTISKQAEDTYRVHGKRIERAAAMTYWEYDEAVERFHHILTALGVTEALKNAGVQEGDIVFIGDYELEWID